MCDLKVGDSVVVHRNGLKDADRDAFKSGTVKKILVEVEFPHLKRDGWMGKNDGTITVAQDFVHKVGKCNARFDLNGTQVSCDLIEGHSLSAVAPNKHHGVLDKVEISWV